MSSDGDAIMLNTTPSAVESQPIPVEQPIKVAQPITVEQWLWNVTVHRYRRQIIWLVVPAVATVFIALLIGYGLWVNRVAFTEESLAALKADYAWRQRVDWRAVQVPTWFEQKCAKMMENPFVTDIESVKIRYGNPSDSELGFLHDMRQLRSLELHTNRATDRTLAALSSLPNLRHLTLVGDKFSVHGLLKLRDAPCLRQIHCQTKQYSAIELAVLRAELRGVEISNATDQLYQPSRGFADRFTPAA